MAATSAASPVDAIAIDADGAPDAYGPPKVDGDLDGSGTDSLKHAGYPDNQHNSIPDDWRDILVADKHDRPVVNAKGYFISKTSLQNETVDDLEPGKFVDASRVFLHRHAAVLDRPARRPARRPVPACGTRG